MKKKKWNKIWGIFFFALIACTGFCIEIVHAKSSNDRFYEGEYIYGTYYKEHKNGYTYYKTARFLERSDGQFAYCLQPFVDFVNGRLQIAYDSDYAAVTHMSQEQWNRVLLLAYYGYQYGSHVEAKWYALTQLMIWRTVDPVSDMYFTDYLDGNRIALYENEMAELEQLISNHHRMPHFGFTNYTISLGETISLEDENGVISGFTVSNDAIVSTNVSGNTLTITGNQLGKTDIYFTKKDTKYHNVPIVYIDSESQDLLVVGSYEPLVHKIGINVVGGKIRITKVDSELGSSTAQGEASLVGAIYHVFDQNHNLVSVLTIENDMTATTDFLPFGDYTIEEVKSSLGYQIDSTVYHVTIHSNDITDVQVREPVIKGRIKITKVDSETNVCKAQGEATLIGAKYGIYNSKNKLVETLIIGKDCTAISNFLPYGNYEVRELTSSTGYQIDPKRYPVKIENEKTVSVTSKESIVKGRIKITKVDSETNMCKAQGEATLIGAKYGIYNSKNELVETLIIGKDCTAISNFLPYGNYEVRELTSSTGYQIDPKRYPVKIENEKTVSVTSKESIVKGRIKITKVDSETNMCKAQGEATLIGAKYGIYNSKNELVETLIIGKDCTAISNFLPYGNYEIRELSSSKGYYLNPEVYNVSILKDVHYPVTVKEEVIQNQFQFYKFYGVEDTGIIHAEANAQFQILNKSGKIVSTIVTDANGYATVTLPYGVYTVKQVSGMSGYQWITPITIEVLEQTSLIQNVYLKDGSIMAKLKLLKIDSETKELIPISGVTFKIKDQNTKEYICQTTDEVICEFQTNENGILYTPLPFSSGTYLIEEIKAPNGYLLATEPLEFSIEESADLTFDPIYGPVIEVYFENQPVKGKLEIHKMGEKVVIQEDTFFYESIPLPDVLFGLYDVDGKFITELITDSNGYAEVGNLKLGTYILKELKSNLGHMEEKQSYTFTLTYQDASTPTIVKTLTISNQLPKGKLLFQKLDAVTKNPISNTEIKIDTEDGSCLYHGSTDENGQIIVPNLYVGKFYIEEIKSAVGYQLRDDRLSFDITENEQLIQVQMENEKIKGELEFMKIDKDTKQPLSDTTIEVYTENGKLVRSGVTNAEGKIRFEGLDYGKYYIAEKEAKEGYTIFRGRLYFEVKEENEIVKVTMEDARIVGGVGFVKVERGTNIPLPGTTVAIYTEKDEFIRSGTTDQDGKILFENLKYGKYYIIEQEAPVGYRLFEGKLPFEIKENDGVVIVRMEDTKIKGTLEFLKVEENTNKPLSDAVIALYTEEGEFVRSGITDSKGKIVFQELEYGRYYLVEKEPPKGYTQLEKKIHFEIKEENELVTITMENAKIIEVPDTASIRYSRFSYVGMLLLIFGFVFITYGKTLSI